MIADIGIVDDLFDVLIELINLIIIGRKTTNRHKTHLDPMLKKLSGLVD